MEINPQDLSDRDTYKLMSGAIVPRPIAWVSTIDSEGTPNLAPFSFFNAVCSTPPTLLFCSSVRRGSGTQKDTYHNIKATGEFVVNFTNKATAEAMNITAVEAAPEVNEFERAGLTPAPSKIVRAPYVKESPISFECKLNQIVTINDQPGGGNIIIGTVVYMHFADGVWKENNYVDTLAYQPIGRLAGTAYTHVDNIFDMIRPPAEVE